MPAISSIRQFFGRTISEGAAFAAGTAIGPTLHPVVQEIANEAWARYQTKPLDAQTAAAIVAEDVDRIGWGIDEAAATGISEARFRDVYGEALNAPGLGELFALWRRGRIDDAGFVHGLRKAKLEGRWDGPLKGLRDVLLSSEELAMMQQQGFVSEARADSEGALQGVTAERQQLRFEASGLPPGIGEALEMLRRSIITEETFAQIVREGHTKTKYTDELLALRERVLSAAEYAGLRLKGWITKAEAEAGGALTGYSPEQMEQMYLDRGRPATTHQVWIGLQRGGTIEGESLSERETFRRAVVQSDIRPEYEPLLWAQRYSYPSAFVLRSLTQAGDLTEAETDEILRFEGWEPTLAAKVAAKWAAGGTSAGKDATAANLRAEYEGLFIDRATLLDALGKLGYDAHDAEVLAELGDAARVKKYRDAVVTATYKAFLAHELQTDQARAILLADGIAGDAIDELLRLWALELSIARRELTVTQIVRAYKRATLSEAEALDALDAHGYTEADARTLLATGIAPAAPTA